MTINKIAVDSNKFNRKKLFYKSARNAFHYFLKSLDFGEGDKILLPSYIGWSSREGSGIFDPIKNLSLNYCFYKLDESLNSDLSDIKTLIKNNKSVKAILIVHYFGFPDSNLEELARIANENNIILIEDCAHALLSDLIGGSCGREGSVSFYSLHKLLPLKYGGALILNDFNSQIELKSDLQNFETEFLQYDLQSIASVRLKNSLFIYNKLSDYVDLFQFLKPLTPNIFPQTIPVLIKNGKRDKLYFSMNEKGYGVVSLYHELISQITDTEFPISHHISQNILNLPVHQDITLDELNVFLDMLINETIN